jgi:hypothetical protein
MSELKILAVPTSTKLSPKAMKMLDQHNCLVIFSDYPERVRLLNPDDSLSVFPSNEFTWAALDALAMSSDKAFSEPDADSCGVAS